MTSKLVVNTIEADTGISSVSFASSISMSSTSKFHFSAAGIDIGADTNISRPAAGVLGFNINGAEKLRIDTNGHLNTSGIVTAANFKSGVTNVHNLGVTLTGGQLDVGSNVKIGTAGVVTATSFVGSGANLTGITQTTINNQADDRMITCSGTANTLNAESDLSFSGGTLSISNGDPKIALVDTTNNTDSYIFSDDNGSIRFQADQNSEASDTRVRFQTDGTERVSIDSNLTISDGNLVVANGHGIDFSATANATAGQYNSINPTTDSEILHDYEYGSFTPHIRTQGGTSNATYAQKGGYYTKIGRQVYCTFFMNWSNASNHSGYIYFVGLPYFSGSNTSSHLMYGIGTVQLNNFTISGNGGAVLHMGSATSGTNLASNNSGGISINEGHTNNGYIMANITYIANY